MRRKVRGSLLWGWKAFIEEVYDDTGKRNSRPVEGRLVVDVSPTTEMGSI